MATEIITVHHITIRAANQGFIPYSWYKMIQHNHVKYLSCLTRPLQVKKTMAEPLQETSAAPSSGQTRCGGSSDSPENATGTSHKMGLPSVLLLVAMCITQLHSTRVFWTPIFFSIEEIFRQRRMAIFWWPLCSMKVVKIQSWCSPATRHNSSASNPSKPPQDSGIGSTSSHQSESMNRLNVMSQLRCKLLILCASNFTAAIQTLLKLRCCGISAKYPETWNGLFCTWPQMTSIMSYRNLQAAFDPDRFNFGAPELDPCFKPIVVRWTKQRFTTREWKSMKLGMQRGMKHNLFFFVTRDCRHPSRCQYILTGFFLRWQAQGANKNPILGW